MATRNVIPYIMAISSFLFLTGCLIEADSGTESGSTVVTEPGAPAFDPTRTICDPFQTNSPQKRDRGLIGSLLYLTDDQPRYSNITDYMNNAHIADAKIYLDRLFVPTRPFDRGFYMESGDLVTNVNGNTLYEYFGLRMSGQLQLSFMEPPGYYQLAVLADDGALLKVPDEVNGGQKIIVNNDGTHPTKMACATEAVYMDGMTKLPFTLEYYQGPRFHISLVAMWRPWPSDVTQVADPYCGQQGNSLFFDSTQDPVTTQPAYHELLERSWKPLENENFFYPEQSLNPCAPVEDPLVVVEHSINNITRTSANILWTTNISADSLVEYRTGSATTPSPWTSSPLDTTLVQSHAITISGLAPLTIYTVRVTSTSAGGQKIVSDEFAFRTLR